MIKKFGQYVTESNNNGLELHYSAFDWDDNILQIGRAHV